jgi:hypothetical protein
MINTNILEDGIISAEQLEEDKKTLSFKALRQARRSGVCRHLFTFRCKYMGNKLKFIDLRENYVELKKR